MAAMPIIVFTAHVENHEKIQAAAEDLKRSQRAGLLRDQEFKKELLAMKTVLQRNGLEMKKREDALDKGAKRQAKNIERDFQKMIKRVEKIERQSNELKIKTTEDVKMLQKMVFLQLQKRTQPRKRKGQ